MSGPDPVDAALAAARALLADPARWCRHARAVNEAGAERRPESSEACRWCARGALDRITFPAVAEAAYTRLCAAAGDRLAGEWWPEDVNEHEGHTAVLAMYDRALVGR